jgi:hypothetical protein
MHALIGLLVLLLGLSGCATLTAPPTLSEAERCARFGGGYSNGSCRTGAP